MEGKGAEKGLEVGNTGLYALRAYAQAKAAGEQHELAQAIPHGFRASTEERSAYWAARDIEEGMWVSQRRSATIATASFLRDHKERKQRERDEARAVMVARKGKAWGRTRSKGTGGVAVGAAGITMTVVRR
jgi:hypothetical protein